MVPTRGILDRTKVPTVVEITNSIVLTLWGLALLFRPQTFVAGVVYDSLEDLAPPWVWGVLALALAAAKTVGWLTEWRALRLGALWAVFFWWIWVTAIVAHAAGLSPGFSIYLFAVLITGREFRERVLNDAVLRRL